MKYFMRIVTFLVIIILTQCISSDYAKQLQSTDSYLIAYYKFNGNLKDEMGFSNGVFAAGNIGSNPKKHFIDGYDGKRNGAILFGGTADTWLRVDLGTFSPVNLGRKGEMTVCFWTYWNGSTGSWQDIINKRDTWAEDGMEWGINHHFLKTGDYLSVRQKSINADSTLTFPVGKWIHVAITADNKNVNFYVNSFLGGTKPFQYGTKSDAVIHAGTSPNGAVDAYNGALDELRFYSRILSEDEIRTIYLIDTKQYEALSTTRKPKPSITPTPVVTPYPAVTVLPLSESDLLIDAFPGAEGYGKVCTGGRGGAVYEVTNLNSSGAGSLGAAIAASGPRTVVFRVGGTIKGTFNIYNDDITIAGQTAPGDGISINGHLNVYANNVIVRYIRVRANVDGDAISGDHGMSRIIFDHVSTSWSSDEVFSIYLCSYVTFQYCIISEGGSKYHRFGGIWGNNYSTYHHNLFAHHTDRSPRIASGAGYNDLRNNVIYNWKNESIYGGEVQAGPEGFGFTATNVVANYFKPGPGTPTSIEKHTRICSPWSRNGAADYGTWYIVDNYLVGHPDVTADNWKGVFPQYTDHIKNDQAAIPGLKLDTPCEHMPINQQTAEEAYLTVLESAGCSLPNRDAVDKRIIEEVRNGTATYGSNGFVSGPSHVGGHPTIQGGPAPVDSDHDGMPDEWEKANGLNPDDANDRNNKDSVGYTMLEVYLNSIDNL